VVLAEQLPVGARLVVVALEIGGRRELHEILVAGLVARQQREVRVALLDPGAAVSVGGHVELEPEDGLDALLLRGAVELDGAAERTVVGERHRGHAEFFGPGDEFLDPARAVEQRVFAVHVKMDECGGHGWPDSSMEGTRAGGVRPPVGHTPQGRADRAARAGRRRREEREEVSW